MSSKSELEKWLDDSFGSGNGERYDAWTGVMHFLDVIERYAKLRLEEIDKLIMADPRNLILQGHASGIKDFLNFLNFYCGRE